MKSRPIFNQGCLQRMGSKGNFMIRGKMPGRNLATLPNCKDSEPDQVAVGAQVQHCIQVLGRCLEESGSLDREGCQKVLGVLLELKRRENDKSSFQDVQQSSPVVFRHTENRNKSKRRPDAPTTQDKQNGATSQVTRAKMPKLKITKESNTKSTAIMQMKLQRLKSKVSLQDQVEQEYQQKIKNMQEQIEVLKAEKQHLSTDLNTLAVENKAIGDRAKQLVQERLLAEGALKAKRAELEAKVEEVNCNLQYLRERLCEREEEIVSLFQSQLK